jgi:hypothetical protein
LTENRAMLALWGDEGHEDDYDDAYEGNGTT